MDAIDLSLQDTLRGFTQRYEPPPNIKQRLLWEARLEQDRKNSIPVERELEISLQMPRTYWQVQIAWNMIYSQCFSHVYML